MLKNVRFISKETSPQPEIISKANVVWIQTNALAHKDYNIIVETARSNRIVVKYFTSASAEKCAREVTKEDKR